MSDVQSDAASQESDDSLPSRQGSGSALPVTFSSPSASPSASPSPSPPATPPPAQAAASQAHGSFIVQSSSQSISSPSVLVRAGSKRPSDEDSDSEATTKADDGEFSAAASSGLHPEILPVSPTVTPRRQRKSTHGNLPPVECKARLSFGKSDGFIGYFHSHQFSDVRLVTQEGSAYAVHRLILAYSSGYLHRLLLKRKYAAADTIHLRHVADPSHVFPYVLQFMYRGSIKDLSTELSIPLLALADRLEMPELKKIASEFIAARIQRDNAVPMLKRAFRVQSQQIIDRCLDVIAVNFPFVPSDYGFLPPDCFLSLVQRERFNVKDEHHLYKVIAKYLDAHRHDFAADPDGFERLSHAALSAVRYVHMPLRHLKRCVANPLVPRDLLVEALVARVQLLENPGQPWQPAETRLQKRKTYGIHFEFPSEAGAAQIGPHSRGIVGWIATKGFTREWKNPHTAKLLTVTASSITKGNPPELVGVSPTELWTKDVPASWFCVDLGPQRLVRPSFYTLRHGGNYRADSLRTWDLQGSIDGLHWSLLSRHASDESLNSAFAVHSWPIARPTGAYRYFRVLQTGHNSSNHNFLVLSGIELYGELFEGTRESIQDALGHSEESQQQQQQQPGPEPQSGSFIVPNQSAATSSSA